MEIRPLGAVIARVVDEYVGKSSGAFEKEAVVQRVLEDPEIQLIRKGLDDHDRSEGLEDVFLRDVRRKVGDRLRRDGCVAENTGGRAFRWHPPERRPGTDV